MNNKTWAAAFLFAAVAMSACAVEGEAGMIKNSSGDVSIVRSGTRIPGAVGTPVFAADKVRTGADGSVGMTLRDSTLPPSRPSPWPRTSAAAMAASPSGFSVPSS